MTALCSSNWNGKPKRPARRPPGSAAAAAHVLVSEHYWQRRDWKEARRNLQQALTFASNHPALLLRLAVLEINLQNYDRALQSLVPVLREERWRADGYRMQGEVYYRQEKLKQAAGLSAQEQKLN